MLAAMDADEDCKCVVSSYSDASFCNQLRKKRTFVELKMATALAIARGFRDLPEDATAPDPAPEPAPEEKEPRIMLCLMKL